MKNNIFPVAPFNRSINKYGDEYTEDELAEIHQFAEFVKNRRK